MIAVQAVTVGSEVTELMAKLEADGEFAEQLFVHGLGVQTAEGLAEWLHAKARDDARDRRHAGPPLLLGLPGRARAVRAPEGGEAARPGRIGMTITDGYAPDPEQSTLALVAHHPQAIYFGTRQGRLLPDGSPDDLIKGSPETLAVRRARRGGPPRAWSKPRMSSRSPRRGRSPSTPRRR